MNLTILGTGNATVTHCYNTCFVLEEKGQYLLVDGGGGNGLLQQLEKAELRWQDMRTVFVTHKHIDHLLGIIWLMRMMCQSWRRGTYDGEATIYAHDEVIGLLRSMATSLLSSKDSRYLDDKLHLIIVEDGDKHTLIGHDVTFFDIRSTKAKQFGFAMELADGRLTCCGDEPCQPWEEDYVKGSKWLLHEAFCLDADEAIFHPYEKIIPPSKTPVNWPSAWTSRTSSSTIRKTAIWPIERPATARKVGSITTATSTSPTT